MFKWKKLGKVFTPQEVEGRSWLREFAQAPATLVFDDFVRVYFSCRPPADENGQYVSYSAFVDLERARSVQDSARCRASDPESWADWASLTSSARIPCPSFAMATKSVPTMGVDALRVGSVQCRHRLAPVSRDGGKTFTKLGNGPVLGYSPDEPFVLSGPKIRRFDGLWYLWYIAGRKWKIVDGRAEPVYKIRMATSTDGIHWTQDRAAI